ncbi:hypothetical protein HanIR_Chr06g0276371 [Helianthus annuus]|nr:hypothetical protein HanIR_Chr06g0276371 [Helianthus annuus]
MVSCFSLTEQRTCWRGLCSPENTEVEDAMVMVLRPYLAYCFHLLVLESFELTVMVLEL